LTYLLDTDVVSQQTKLKPHEGVVRWLSSLRADEMYLSVVSLTEIRFGIEEMPKGRKRDNFERWLEHDLPKIFAGRILAVSAEIAEEGGRMLSLSKKLGRKPDVADALIAATALVHKLSLATLNRNDFEKLPIEMVRL
jgi:predicted nucleic acid-binding protein